MLRSRGSARILRRPGVIREGDKSKCSSASMARRPTFACSLTAAPVARFGEEVTSHFSFRGSITEAGHHIDLSSATRVASSRRAPREGIFVRHGGAFVDELPVSRFTDSPRRCDAGAPRSSPAPHWCEQRSCRSREPHDQTGEQSRRGFRNHLARRRPHARTSQRHTTPSTSQLSREGP